MTTLDRKAGVGQEPAESANTKASTDEQSTGAPALITEQQVLFGSAAALTPARKHAWGHSFTVAVRGLFTRPEKPRVQRHYPQRFAYLENAAMSRAMDRL